MRILVVTHYFAEHRGGVEIVAGELNRRLAQRGVKVVWAASGPVEGPLCEGVTRLPMRVCNVAERRLGFPYPVWSPSSLLRLEREMRRCDLVHLHDSLYMGNVAAYLFARWRRKPVVVTQHVGPVPYSRWILRALLGLANHTLGRLVLGGCERALFVSPKVRNFFGRFVHFRQPSLYIPNGVDRNTFQPVIEEQRQRLRRQLGFPTDKMVLLFVGRFVEKKGLPLLRQLAGELPECEWVFIGWGAENPAAWGLANVHCPGALPQAEIVRYYRAADLLVLPSVGEGFPLVVQEAMACGLPAMISTDTAAGADNIRSLAYSVELKRDRWLESLRELSQYPAGPRARRERVAEFAARDWDWESCADQYEQLFQDILGQRVNSCVSSRLLTDVAR